MRSFRAPSSAHSYVQLERHAPSTSASLSRHGPLITRALDVLREGLAFFDLEERPVHTNQTLRRVLSEQADGEEIRREIRRFTESLGALVRRRQGHAGEMLEEMAVRDFHTSEGSYLLRGSFVGEGHEDGGGLLLVALDSVGAEFLSEELLQARYNLTSRQCRLINEVPLVPLVLIVIMVVVKPHLGP